MVSGGYSTSILFLESGSRPMFCGHLECVLSMQERCLQKFFDNGCGLRWRVIESVLRQLQDLEKDVAKLEGFRFAPPPSLSLSPPHNTHLKHTTHNAHTTHINHVRWQVLLHEHADCL